MTQVNFIRRALRSQAQLARKMVIEPTIAQWRKTRPHPIGLEFLDRVSLQLERAEEARPVKQAEPKPVEPILPGLRDLTATKPKQKQVELREQIEQPVKVEVEPKPAPRWEKPALL